MSEKDLGYRFGSWLVNKPWQALILLLLVLGAAFPQMSKLKEDFSYRIWFRPNDPLLAKFDAFERRFGNDESLAVIVHSPSGIFDRESVQLLQELTRQMWQVPEIIRVDSLSNFNWVHGSGDDIIVEPLLPDDEELTPEFLEARKKVALAHESLPEYLVSRDGQSALIFAQLKPALNGTPNYELVVKKTREKIADLAKGDHHFYLTGGVEISDSFRVATWGDVQRIIPLVFLMALIFLGLFFRRVSGVVLPFAVIAMSIVTTLATAALLGRKMNNMTSILPQMLVAVGMADAVHILVTYFQVRATGVHHKEAARLSFAKNFIPTLLTSLTTAIGFLSFSSAKLMPLADLGLLGGIGTIYAWFITHLFLGPILSWIPLKVKVNPNQLAFDQPSAFGLRYARLMAKHSRAIIVGFLVTTVAAFVFSLKNEVNSDPMEYFTDKVPLRIANRFMEDRVGSALGAELVINSGQPDGIKDPDFLRRVEIFQNWLDQQPKVTKTISIIDILKQMNRSLNGEDPAYYRVPTQRDEIAQQLFLYTMNLPQGMDLNNRITLANDAIRLTVMWKIHDSTTAIRNYRAFEEKARALGLDVHVTGKSPLYQQMNDYVVESFLTSFFSSSILIALIIGLVLRSAHLGMLAMIPNLVPVAFGGAVVFLLGQYVDIGVVLVASITLGISVDDTIHFLANYRRLRLKGEEPVRAIANLLTHTAPALLVTTIVLVTSFGSFVFATFRPNQNFGVLCALILTLALAVELTLTPAILLFKDRKRIFETHKPEEETTL